MCTKTIEKNRYEFGFSLLEIAIVLVIVGLIIAPAVQIYHNYRIDKDWNETGNNKGLVVQEIGSFRTLFGRYPCPASMTAAPGDTDYGLENAACHGNPSAGPPVPPVYPAAGTCANGICAYNNGGGLVLVGAFPYKIVDLFESEAYDSNNIRFVYAVTAGLTNVNTFVPAGGAIGIVDKAGNSVIDPPDSSDFVVLSHGKNKIGGYTRSGVLVTACTDGSAAEQENCDADGVFLSGGIEDDFDDRVAFFSSAPYAEWQRSELDQDMIHLKNSHGIALGATAADDLSSAEETTVKAVALDTGSVLAQGDFFVQNLCDESAAIPANDCFAPRLIAGDLTPDVSHFGRLEGETNPGYGMSCYRPSLPVADRDQYLIGIKNNGPICSKEVFISCPDGSFIKGINASGVVKCDTAPQPWCPPETKLTSCDGRISTTTSGLIGNPVLGTASGGIEFLYSGECRKIIDRDSTYFAAQSYTDYADVQAHIATLNDPNGNGDLNDDRTIVDCNAGEAGSQVRDGYLCTAGNWSHILAHEKLGWQSTSFPSNAYSNVAPLPAEIDFTGSDNDNTNNYHDCWCREDYRVRQISCSDGTNRGFAIDKHECPQTDHSWHPIHTDGRFCTCMPTTKNENLSCNAYYDEVNGSTGTSGLSGNVTKKFNVTCPTGPSGPPVQDATPYDVDANCSCQPQSPVPGRTYCDQGTTNSWTSPFGTETGVKTLSINSWTCPSDTISDSFSNNIPKPGSWGGPVSYGGAIPPCVCDTNLTKFEYRSCPSNLSGPPNAIKYKVEWDCVLNDWEPESNWELISSNCHGCKWQSSGAGSPAAGSYADKIGDICDCSEPPVMTCTELNASGIPAEPHLTHAPCQCTVQN